jgi:hypothetical protein
MTISTFTSTTTPIIFVDTSTYVTPSEVQSIATDTTVIQTQWIANPRFAQWHKDNLAMVLYNTKKRAGTLTNETYTVETPEAQYTVTIDGNTITLYYDDGTVKTYTDPTPDQPLADSDDFDQFI